MNQPTGHDQHSEHHPSRTRTRDPYTIDSARLFTDVDTIRRLKGLTIDQAAHVANCSRATLYALSRGHSCYPSTLLHICQGFRLPPCQYVANCSHEPDHTRHDTTACPEARMLAALRDMGIAKHQRHTLVQLAVQLTQTSKHTTTTETPT